MTSKNFFSSYMINGHSVVPGTCRFKSFVLGVKKGWAQKIADILCPPNSMAPLPGYRCRPYLPASFVLPF